jgi:hypothetical protein
MFIQSILAAVSASSNGSGGGGGGGGNGQTYRSWTIQWWMKKLSPQVSTVARVFAVGVDTSASIGYSNEQGGDYVWTNGGTGPLTVGSITNQWVHISINSDGTNLYVYKNGQQLTVTARTGNAITDASTQFWMGGDTNSHWKGRIADFNIVKGNCLYNTTYTPPTRITAANLPAGTVFMQCGDPGAQSGPGASGSSNYSNVNDDPWGDEFTSLEFNGTTASYVRWDGNAIFALDVA